MKFRTEKLGSKILVQVYDRGKTPRSQRSAKGVLCMACSVNQMLRLKTVRQPMAIFICPHVAKLYWKAIAIVWQLLRIFGVTL
ncbi:hypothetical protein [Paenibacillus xylanexedens]|uniref:hypothetical protein n=1 Tax=Paenibacillus xylanexedens TaxID=528191 RepID=UPI0012F50D5B|nr:hypothetical protein [Paenibacillus xylanexedens]